MVDLSSLHLKPEELMQYLDGELEQSRVVQHLSTCSQCRSALKDLVLARALLTPPPSEMPSGHIPPGTLAEYQDDILTMEQNRAVEDHYTGCRRCLTDYIGLKMAVAAEHEDAPAAELVEKILASLEEYRSRKSLGTMFFKKFRKKINLVFKPQPDPADVGNYAEEMARSMFPFKGGPPHAAMAAMEPTDMALYQTDKVYSRVPEFEAGDLIERRHLDEPTSKTVPTESGQVSLSVEEREGKHRVTVQVVDSYGDEPLADINVELLVGTELAESLTTDQNGLVTFDLPANPSTLRVYLDKVYELDLEPPI
jgi:hypothetical protein